MDKVPFESYLEKTSWLAYFLRCGVHFCLGFHLKLKKLWSAICILLLK